MNRARARLVLASCFGLLSLAIVAACQVDRTEAFVVNDLPVGDVEPLTV